MALRQMIVRRLEKDRLAQSAANRRFEMSEGYDVEGRRGLLTLKKRTGPALAEAGFAIVFGSLFAAFTWHIYLSSNDHDTWPGWILLLSLFGPAIAVARIRNVWHILQGDIWTLDSEDGHIEHNGEIVATKDQVKYVRGWVGSDKEYHLELVLRRGKPAHTVYIGEAGSWDECSAIAQRIADYAQLPLKLK